MGVDSPVRSLVLWFPDWPVVALARDVRPPGVRPPGVRPPGVRPPGVRPPGARPPGGRPPGVEAPGVEAVGGDEALEAVVRAVVEPIAVVERNLVIACSAAARAEGVRRGQRRRDAQARCPTLTIVPADTARDQRAFAPVVALIEEKAPGVQLVRPGLCALHARGPARYYGGEAEAARRLVAVLHAVGIADVRAGIADGPFTAEQAARHAAGAAEPVFVVPAGGAPGFLAPLSVTTLDETSPASGGAADLVGLLARLGVQTLGEFAAMASDRVRERFGDRGARLHALAGGRDSQQVRPRTPPPELQREIAFEPPLEIADQVAFGMRVTADDFIDGLGALGLVCTELRVELVGDRAERSERVWLHPGMFDAAAVVDRVRWQLAEAQEAPSGGGVLRSGVARVRITPEAVDAASHHAPALFGGGPEERVHHALSRVQAMLGHRGVLTPAIGGGRWLVERQVLVPWGDRDTRDQDARDRRGRRRDAAGSLAAQRALPWPGSLPDPLPATVFGEPVPVEVRSVGGDDVDVDERGTVSAVPAVLIEGGRRRSIQAWAGPWPVVERGWDAVRARRAHRFQVVDADGAAWLLVCEGAAWTAEATYD